jgi:integrase
MRGHIKQRSKGSWSIVIDVGRDPQTGKRQQQWHTVRGTKKEAEAKLRVLLDSLEKGVYVKPNKMTVGEWLEEWLNNYATLNVSPRTLEGYKFLVRRHITPALGALELTKLESRHLQSYYAKSLAIGRLNGNGGLGNRSVQYQHRIISNALKHAVKMGVLSRNVAQTVDPPRLIRKPLSVLAPEDLARFLEAAKNTIYYPLLFTALYTGMRRGELLALRWRDIALAMATLSVVNSMYRLNRQTMIKEPKSPHSRRMIALPPTLTLMLSNYKIEQARQREIVGKPLSDSDFVFAHIDGEPIDPDTVTQAFGNILQKAGLPHLRFHDLRHTHATLMLKAGVHPKIVSERLGHAKVSITLDIYSHILPGLQEAAAESFDKMLKPKVPDVEDVSKMLANGGGLNGGADGIRTHYLLTASQTLSRLSYSPTPKV